MRDAMSTGRWPATRHVDGRRGRAAIAPTRGEHLDTEAMSAFVTTSLAVVLAAGLGTRLGIDRPKALLEIGGRTLLEHTLVACRAAGIEQVILVTGHRA